MNAIDTLSQNPYPDYFREDAVILDIHTSSRYWRTGNLLEADLIVPEGDYIREIRLISEKEADEYDIMLRIGTVVRESGTLYSFNGTSFCLPFLKRKYSAYRKEFPLDRLRHTDLLYELRSYDSLLPLTSHKLSDYRSLLSPPAGASSKDRPARPESAGGHDAGTILETLPLLEIRSFAEGSFRISDIVKDSSGKEITFRLSCDLLFPIRYSSDHYSITGKGREVTVRAEIDNGNLRLYHKDFKNYLYLPIEGYAVHKSVASYIAASRKTAAVKENCYTYIPLSDKFLSDYGKVTKYLVSVINYCSERR